jgi:hypothetical protein
VILLFGVRTVFNLIARVTFVCHLCGVEARQDVVEQANRFTFFLIPLFTFSRRYFNECANCGGRTELSAEQARRGAEWASIRAAG